MVRLVRRRLLAALVVLPVLPAAAQPAAGPSPEAISLASIMLAKMSGDPTATIHQLGGPMVAMLQQMGISDPDRARVIVQEALIPLLTSHYQDLLSMWAKDYAATLSAADMKAAIAFYESSAGRSLVAAGPKLDQAKFIDLTQWMAALQPEMQQRIEQALKAHGWENN
ncbi:MAG TPA: DUF2059 domain-containing protein [Acetobacteraceae bacterium]|nr:DUF2059 domain-containing protein [Acetobacteraceae bacterium]